jgi:MFS transporter, DHA1 family, inner membrane transport protein
MLVGKRPSSPGGAWLSRQHSGTPAPSGRLAGGAVEEVYVATTREQSAPAITRTRLTLAIAALAVGGFGIGTTEFVTMGLLPDIASGLDLTIPQAGHAISAYALGVVVGAPLIAVIGARLPRRAMLVGLMVLFGLGNVATAMAQGNGSLVAARFMAGLPHGAYFGVAALVAASLVPEQRRARAIAGSMLGLPIANVIGVPAVTWLGQQVGWRTAYGSIAVIGLVTIAALLVWVPHQPPCLDATARRELGALRQPQVWLTLAVGTIGFGGMFAMYSYISPTMTDLADLAARWMPLILASYGLGMVAGIVLAGRLVDRSLPRSLVGSLVAIGALLAVFPLAARNPVTASIVLFLVAVAASVQVLALQVRLMDVAVHAQTLAAALNHAGLNAANALGAWLGGLAIAAGWGYVAPSWVGVGLAAAGLVVLMYSLALSRSASRSASAPTPTPRA